MAEFSDDRRSIFIVGSSRSGTTMMGRILDRHPKVYTFHELHFFEQLWSPKKGSSEERAEAVDRAAELLHLERDAGYLSPDNSSTYRTDAEELIDEGPPIHEMTALDIYRTVLFREAEENGTSIPCEQTPRNIFYLEELLDQFPGARILHMVRDPRDVLLSQKRKWRRRFLGASNLPRTEVARSWVNYHPLTISQLWRASVQAVVPFHDHPRVHAVAFEDVLNRPERTVREICEYVGISFRKSMLSVRQIGSSHQEDRPDERGIDSSRAGTWHEGGLSDTEVFLCETVAEASMKEHGYEPADRDPNPLRLMLSLLLFPIKLGGAFLLNLPRMDDVRDAVRRRWR